MNGEAMIDLAAGGCFDQLVACGLKTVSSQLKFKKLVKSSNPTSTCSVVKDSMDDKGSKLKLSQLKLLSAEERRVYLTMLVIMIIVTYNNLKFFFCILILEGTKLPKLPIRSGQEMKFQFSVQMH